MSEPVCVCLRGEVNGTPPRTPAHNLQCSRSAPRRKPDKGPSFGAAADVRYRRRGGTRFGEGARGELTEVLTFLGCGSSFVRFGLWSTTRTEEKFLKFAIAKMRTA